MSTDHVDFALLVLRVAAGLMIVAHGWNHVWGGGRIEGTARWFGSLGMRPGRLHAWVASATELAIGPMLVLGLLTPVAAAGLLGVLLVAWVTNHVTNGFFTFRPGEGWEYVAVICMTALALGTMGPGRWSLDDAIGFELDGAASLLVTLLGAAGAALLLLVFWRPDERPPLAFVLAPFTAVATVGLFGVLLIGDGAADAIVEPDQVSFGALVLRVTLGLVMVAHGWNHIWGGGKIEGTAGWFGSLGMRPGRLHAWLASVTELVVGPMLVLGLLTSLAAAGVVGVLVVAWIINHLANGFFIFRKGEGWEYVAFASLVAVALGTIGGGEWSLDEPLELLPTGPAGLGMVLLGPLAALALLAVAWRPGPDTPVDRAGTLAVVGVFVVIGAAGFVLIDDDADLVGDTSGAPTTTGAPRFALAEPVGGDR